MLLCILIDKFKKTADELFVKITVPNCANVEFYVSIIWARFCIGWFMFMDKLDHPLSEKIDGVN